MPSIAQTLQTIFKYDFATCKDPADFHRHFFDTALDLEELKCVCDLMLESSVTISGKTIPAAITIKGKTSPSSSFCILAQLHGNEPAGLAGILLALALSEAGHLEQDVIGIIGNPLAARQYFEAWQANPKARQEARDAYRCGLDENGKLLADMNRIPVDFMQQDSSAPHIKRAQELYHVGQHISGIADLHTARGNMICVTDHKRDMDLKFSPIRSVLTELADAISGHASGKVTVQTLKTVLSTLPNIGCQLGIEAGRHEEPYTPHVAASFVLSLLHTLSLCPVKPLHAKENGVFTRYSVKPRITYADLTISGKLLPEDEVYMVTECTSPDSIPKQSDQVVVKKKDGTYAIQTILENIITPKGDLVYALYQYDEMIHIKKDHVVALAIPSGITFKAPQEMWGIFFSKSAALYDKDPAVGPWPVAADKLSSVKFCYPCEVSKMKIDFGN
jgi:hypothetical protein